MEFVTENKPVFEAFRAKYPEFTYRSYAVRREGLTLALDFTYELSPEESLTISMTIALPEGVSDEAIAAHDAYFFRVGLIEALSYWKAYCSPRVLVACGTLPDAERDWWLETWYDGMGEFRYRNGLLDVKKNDWVTFSFEGPVSKMENREGSLSGNLIAFTGGKDSTLALGLVHDSVFGPNETFFVQADAPERAKILEALGVSGYPETTIVRAMHPRLLALNKDGALNGHTPFSIVVAFLGMLVASLRGRAYIIVANEASADQPTVPGTDINHQYSKSFHFEKRFQQYARTAFPGGPAYFSLLRPLSEIGIMTMLAKYDSALPFISSCNTKNKTGLWCGACAKCLFAFLLFVAVKGHDEAVRLIGTDMLQNAELRHMRDELVGLADTRPFECVGTTEESSAILARIFANDPATRETPLLSDFWKERQDMLPDASVFDRIACEFHEHAFPNPSFVELMKKAQDQVCYG